MSRLPGEVITTIGHGIADQVKNLKKNLDFWKDESFPLRPTRSEIEYAIRQLEGTISFMEQQYAYSYEGIKDFLNHTKETIRKEASRKVI